MEKAFDISMIASFVPTLLGYLPVTLYILAVSLLFGFLLGLLLALPRIYRIPVLNQFAKLYISFFRGTPIMVQLFIVFTAFRRSRRSPELIPLKWTLCMRPSPRMR